MTGLRREAVARETIAGIGYDGEAAGFDGRSCEVLVRVHAQAPEIAQGVNEDSAHDKPQGAGDQGLMFGFACNETDEAMPLPITLAHRLTRQLSAVRKAGKVGFLRPDGKSQVTIEYRDDRPTRIHTVVISTQHDPDVSNDDIHAGIDTQNVVEKKLAQEGRLAILNVRSSPSGSLAVIVPARVPLALFSSMEKA